ncbi:MAG: hypothetical protein ABIS67_05600 [Candidatus Eisenbacteria bacterium]
MQNIQGKTLRLGDRALIGGIVLLVLVFLGAEMAHSAEVIPSVGIARASDGGDSRLYTGIALRTGLAPFAQTELGVAYRKEEFPNNGGSATTWPVTASVWFAPIPFLYAGGGVGWYHTSFSYEGVPLAGSLAATDQSFGTHLGGGIRMPLAPMVGLDLNARFVNLKSSDNSNVPSNYDPKFWSVALGLGVKL